MRRSTWLAVAIALAASIAAPTAGPADVGMERTGATPTVGTAEFGVAAADAGSRPFFVADRHDRDRGSDPAGPCPGAATWSRRRPGAIAAAGTARSSATLRVPVLMYHHVRPLSMVRVDEPYPDLFVDARTFAAQMAALSAAGWRTITARELAEAVTARTAIPARTLVITFDDGRPDTYTYAFPILERYGFTATFFIVPGRIGSRQHLTTCQLEELAAAGDELADHTQTHVDLTTLTFDEVRWQIGRAADAIQALAGERPTTLAYPYGRANATVEAAASAEGMELCFTTRHGAVEDVDGRLAEPRLRVAGLRRLRDGRYAGGTTARELLAMLAPYAGT